MTEKLKPCPFCGSSEVNVDKDIIFTRREYYYVWCGYCMASGPEGKDEQEAIKKWNQRVKQK